MKRAVNEVAEWSVSNPVIIPKGNASSIADEPSGIATVLDQVVDFLLVCVELGGYFFPKVSPQMSFGLARIAHILLASRSLLRAKLFFKPKPPRLLG